MKRLTIAIGVAVPAVLLAPAVADACGGLIGENGSIQLVRTTTLAAYSDGVERYVTAFEFTGEGESVGSIVPLPDVPTKVERGGDWTLQRLALEVAPPERRLGDEAAGAATAEQAGVEIILEAEIDALDITVLKGGGDEVGRWAIENGFLLTPDSPEVLDFYAQRSEIFLAAAFDGEAAAARGQNVGDGTPVHITIPTDNPWVPLRILALGKTGSEIVEADVYLMTDARPALLPAPDGFNGMTLDHSRRASASLLEDLRSDRGMEWIPERAWLTKVALDGEASQFGFDLAIDATGANAPSRVAAGLDLPGATDPTGPAMVRWLGMVLFLVGALGSLLFLVTRPTPGRGPRAA